MVFLTLRVFLNYYFQMNLIEVCFSVGLKSLLNGYFTTIKIQLQGDSAGIEIFNQRQTVVSTVWG